ncbi:MAG: DUF3747 domain-containing protein [Leptolyngbya sp. DLM2.Bin15]|nr:MAG: DUF3747 domain-containing protein [Leptolyngbya sp. DLM2.Bin15]
MVKWRNEKAMVSRSVGKMRSLLLSVGLMVAGVGASAPAIAVEFEQQSVPAEDFILVASPVGENHQLLLLRQLSSERACWSEQDGVVDLLLTSFDFSGICGRSTDSNGYSVRMAGQDLGMDYSLRLMRSSDSLVLMAVPDRDRSAPSFALGQTNRITTGFAKIYLYPNWYISQRAYNGQTLGHFYLTHEQDLRSTIAAAPQRELSATLPPSAEPVVRPDLSAPDLEPEAVEPEAVEPALVPAPVAAAPPAPVTAPTQPATGDWIEFGQTPTQLGAAPSPQPPAPTPPPPIAQGAPPVLPPPTPLEPVPNMTPPLGNTTLMPNVAVAAPSPQAAVLGFNYRVIVNTTSSQQEAQVRSLVPDAFRTNLNGRTVMQAGLFEDRTAADQLQRSLSSQGLSASVVPIN